MQVPILSIRPAYAFFSDGSAGVGVAVGASVAVGVGFGVGDGVGEVFTLFFFTVTLHFKVFFFFPFLRVAVNVVLPTFFAEIGRESCRERVCLYV